MISDDALLKADGVFWAGMGAGLGTAPDLFGKVGPLHRVFSSFLLIYKAE